MNFSEEALLSRYPFNSSDNPFLIDVGAHHGSLSLAFASKKWNVIAFEPEMNNRADFERNLAGYSLVTCIAKAVSDKTGDLVPFYVSNKHWGIHSLKPWHNTHELAYKVETVRLDTILKEMQVPRVTLLKIDTEGADFLVLKGFNWDKFHPELVMTEFMDERTVHNFNYDHHEVVHFMKERGYTAFVSEWAPIKQYGIKGKTTDLHTWIQCVPYPLDREPAWGNLIFVTAGAEDKFRRALYIYLQSLRREMISQWVRKRVKSIPGAQRLYSRMKGKWF